MKLPPFPAASLLLACAFFVPVSSAVAQPAAGAAATTEASPSPAPGKQAGRGHAQWWGADVTPGWSLMSWKERNEHRKHMRAMKTYDECKTYLDQHHERMAARAKEKGVEPFKPASHDACERLKP